MLSPLRNQDRARESPKMWAKRSLDSSGSSGTQAPPALRIASNATGKFQRRFSRLPPERRSPRLSGAESRQLIGRYVQLLIADWRPSWTTASAPGFSCACASTKIMNRLISRAYGLSVLFHSTRMR